MTLEEALRWADDVTESRSLSVNSAAYTAPGVLAAELRRLQAENERLKALCLDLDKYADHTNMCSISYKHDIPCDCEYGAVVERLKELTGT